MHAVLKFLKTSLIGGALVVLPAWIAVLLLIKLLVKLEVIVKPVSSHLPKGVDHPLLMAIVLIIVACFLVGLAIQTAFGNSIKRTVESTLLDKIPGYTTLHNVANQIVHLEENHSFQPALVEIEEALAPCFIVEAVGEEHSTVFIPSAPTPAAGTILIITNKRVHPVDVSVTKLFQCVTKWGTGAGELLAAVRKTGSSPIAKPADSPPLSNMPFP